MLRWCLSAVGGHGSSSISRLRCNPVGRREYDTTDSLGQRHPTIICVRRFQLSAPEFESVRTGCGRRSHMPDNHSPSGCSSGSDNKMMYSCVGSLFRTGSPSRPANASQRTASNLFTTDAQLAPAPSTEPRSRHRFNMPLKLTSRPTSLIVLRNFLSQQNMSSPNPQMHTPNTLKSLYTSVRSQSQLTQLGSDGLSALISLLGSLSLPHPRVMCVYVNKFVSHLKVEEKGRDYWLFVLSVARDKERLGMGLTNADRYWIMRAQLARIGGEISQQSDTISRARTQYLRIYRYTADPEVHVPYIQALLSFRTLEYLTEAVEILSALLVRHVTCHPRLVAVLWKLILGPGFEIPTSLALKLLSALASRLSKFKDTIITDSTRASQRTQSIYVSHNNHSSSKVSPNLGVADLCANLTRIIFHRSSISRQQPIEQWSVSLALAVFASDTPVEARWCNLVLLALFNAPPELSGGRNGKSAQSFSCSEDSAVVDWRAVYALAMLETAIRNVGSLDLPTTDQSEGLRDIARALWRAWSGVTRETHQSPAFVARAVIASFFRLAAVSFDTPLIDACYRYSVANLLWIAEENDELARAQTRTLIVEYVIACVSCGKRTWNQIFSTLNEIFSGATWQPEIASVLINHLLQRDPTAAHRLFLFCVQKSIHVPASLIHSLGMSLVSTDHVDLATSLLQDHRFSQAQIQELLNAALLILARRQSSYVDPKLVVPVCDAIHARYASLNPSTTFRWHIESVLLLAVSSGNSSKAIAIIQTIQHRSPSYFTFRFFFRLLRSIIARRQFRLTMRLLDLVAKAQPSHVKAFRRALTLGLTNGGASALARRANRCQMGLSTTESLVRALDFRPRFPSRVLALRILPILQHTSDVSSTQYALHLLICANRTLAAQRLFERTHGKLDTKARTSLGNILLHGVLLRPSRRNGRQMRKVLSVLDLLVQKYSFVPDRITINILLKSLLLWDKAIGSDKLKALFDHMMRSRYAGHDAEAPFGTPLSPHGSAHLPSFVSFERHIRPMYKMFIKAFHVRGDVQFAQIVIGILKAEERAMLERRDIRFRARQVGRVRARKLINEGRM